MSEEDRSRLYAWFREQLDERRAEYMMSCLAPAPLSDLVTKEHLERVLSSEFSEFALTLADQREADRKETADQREADRKEQAALRGEDRAASRVRHFWLAGIGLSALVSIWLDAAGVIG